MTVLARKTFWNPVQMTVLAMKALRNPVQMTVLARKILMNPVQMTDDSPGQVDVEESCTDDR
jgi:hypothetical protein